MSNLTILNTENFENFTKNGIVVIDVWSPTCGPCVQLLPIFEQVATDLSEVAAFGKLNAQEHRNTAVELNVRSIPTLLFYKDGEIVNRSVGMKSGEEIKTIISEILA